MRSRLVGVGVHEIHCLIDAHFPFIFHHMNMCNHRSVSIWEICDLHCRQKYHLNRLHQFRRQDEIVARAALRVPCPSDVIRFVMFPNTPLWKCRCVLDHLIFNTYLVMKANVAKYKLR